MQPALPGLDLRGCDGVLSYFQHREQGFGGELNLGYSVVGRLRLHIVDYV